MEIFEKITRRQQPRETAETERVADLPIYKLYGNVARRTFYALAGTVTTVAIIAPGINLSVGLWQLHHASKDPDTTLFEEFGREMNEFIVVGDRE